MYKLIPVWFYCFFWEDFYFCEHLLRALLFLFKNFLHRKNRWNQAFKYPSFTWLSWLPCPPPDPYLSPLILLMCIVSPHHLNVTSLLGALYLSSFFLLEKSLFQLPISFLHALSFSLSLIDRLQNKSAFLKHPFTHFCWFHGLSSYCSILFSLHRNCFERIFFKKFPKVFNILII